MQDFKPMEKEEIKQIRSDLGLTQKQFGIELGFTITGAQRSIHHLENGRPIKPAYAKLARIIHSQAVKKDE